MVDALTPVLPLVDDYSIPLLETLLSCNLGGYVEHVSNQKSVSFLHFCQLSKTVSLLWNHQKMCLCCRVDVSEGHDEVIFIQFVTRQLSCHYLVEYRDLLIIRSCRSLTIDFHLIIILKRRWKQCSNVRYVTIPTTAITGNLSHYPAVTHFANLVST